MAITEAMKAKLEERMAKRGRGSVADTEQIVRRFLAGERASEIAHAMGIQKETVYRHLRKVRDE